MHFSDLEYVGLERSPLAEGKKHMLYIEMEFLTAIKKHQAYKKLRKQEFAAKSLLKKTITELKNELEIFDTFIPQLPKEHTLRPQMQIKQQIIQEPKRNTIEAQIDEIREKIAKLQ